MKIQRNVVKYWIAKSTYKSYSFFIGIDCNNSSFLANITTSLTTSNCAVKCEIQYTFFNYRLQQPTIEAPQEVAPVKPVQQQPPQTTIGHTQVAANNINRKINGFLNLKTPLIG